MWQLWENFDTHWRQLWDNFEAILGPLGDHLDLDVFWFVQLKTNIYKYWDGNIVYYLVTISSAL